MPIIGLTNDITPRYARIGKLRKGGEKTSNGYGQDLDYFRFVSEFPEVTKAFNEIYPGKPRSIRIFIPHDTVEAAFPTWCELWNKTGLVHRCDGQNMYIWREGSRYERGKRPCTGGHKDNDAKRDSVGRLEFIVPELVEHGFVGYVTLETHSLHDILNITRVLSAVYKTAGTLAGVEFFLNRVKENIGVPGWGDRKNDRARADKWLVRLEPSRAWVKMQLEWQRASAMQLHPASSVTALPEPQPNQVPDDLPVATIAERSVTHVDTLQPANSDLLDESSTVIAPTQPTGQAPADTDISDDEARFFGQPPETKSPAPATTNGDADPKASGVEKKPNARAKTAAIRVAMNRYNDFCKTFADQFPAWQDKEGKPDKFHIGASFAACGFTEVTKENFEEATAALIRRASHKQLAQA